MVLPGRVRDAPSVEEESGVKAIVESIPITKNDSAPSVHGIPSGNPGVK